MTKLEEAVRAAIRLRRAMELVAPEIVGVYMVDIDAVDRFDSTIRKLKGEPDERSAD